MDALRFVEHCIDTYAERAWRMAYAMLSNVHDADDLLQQAFIVAWRKADHAPRENPWPWLAAIIAGEAYNARRKRSRRAAAPLDQAGDPAMQPNQQRELEQAELHALVHLALNELSPEQRIAIVLTHLSGLTQEQAAKAVGVPLDTLKARVRRGMDKLREVVRTDDGKIEKLLLTLPAAFGAGGLAALKAGWLTTVQSEAALAATAGLAAAGTGKSLYLAAAGLALTAVILLAVLANLVTPPWADAGRNSIEETRNERAQSIRTGDRSAERVKGADLTAIDDLRLPAQADQSSPRTNVETATTRSEISSLPSVDETADTTPAPHASRYMVHRVFTELPEPGDAPKSLTAFEKWHFVNGRSMEGYRSLAAARLHDDTKVRVIPEVLERGPWQARSFVIESIKNSDNASWLTMIRDWLMKLGNIRAYPVASEQIMYALMNSKFYQTPAHFEKFVAQAKSAAASYERTGVGDRLFIRVAHELGAERHRSWLPADMAVKLLAELGSSLSRQQHLLAYVECSLERLTGQRGLKPGEFAALQPAIYRPLATERVVLSHGDLRLEAVRRSWGGNEVEMLVLPDFGLNFDVDCPHLTLLNRGRNCVLVNLPVSYRDEGVETYGKDGFFIPINSVVEAIEAYRGRSGGRKFGVMAHGLSGWIALEYMKQHPDSLDFCILVCPWLGDMYRQYADALAARGSREQRLVGDQMLGSGSNQPEELFDYAAEDIAMRRKDRAVCSSLALRALRCRGSGRVLVPQFEPGQAPWQFRSAVPTLVAFAEGSKRQGGDEAVMSSLFIAMELVVCLGGEEPWADSGSFHSALMEFMAKHNLN